jgi:phosphohistidine phosphatase
MRHLLLLRHAKAAAGGPGIADRERPLAPRGNRDAALIGAALAAEGMIPDLVLCSPTRRTRETLDGVVSRFPAAPRVIVVDALYAAADGDYVDAISELGGTAKRLLVVAHNPTIHATALALAGSGDEALRSRLAGKFPTAGLALIAFKGNAWSATLPGSGELMQVLPSRDLGSAEADD